MAPVGVVRGFAVSYRAIACALALEDVSVGERLVAFSLASYTNRAHLAWPSARTAAARAGLGRRQYLTARDRLVERRLITLQESNGGAVIRLAFVEAGPPIEREVNAELFEAVLSRSRAHGGARALLGALAALASVDGVVDGVSTEELCEASGLSDRTYRRARAELLARDEVLLEHAGGGRGCQNVWRVLGTGAAGDAVSPRAVRRAPAPCQLPLVAAVREEPAAARKEPPVRGKSGRQGPGIPGRNPGVNPGQNCTPPAAETPAQSPAETRASYVRAGSGESLNQGTRPPDPPEGGHPVRVEITEAFTSPKGRRRVRRVRADPGELVPVADEDRVVWREVRERLREVVGASMFEIWLAAVEPIAVSRADRALLLAANTDSHAWVASRYRQLLDVLSAEFGRLVRMASDRELALHRASASTVAVSPSLSLIDDHDRREAI